tara:strand:- start:50 stop:406 length:357 start_codon:yes stop_codon:yes gene_type:complete
MQVKFEDSGTPLKRSKNRRGETCEEQLRRMCVSIADSITSPDKQVHKWMEDTYDIRYLVDSRKLFLGAEILCAGGGPTIWVDTFREQVTGWWGTDRVQIYFQDNLGLNDYCGDLYDGH